jgi:N-sulfoglucosamine sulfohydrolase
VVGSRDHALVGKERTDIGRPNDWGYPIRGVVTSTHLFLKNYEPTRWPAGNPETGYLDTDASPSKTLILKLGRQDRKNLFWQLNFGMRPSEELYNLQLDVGCVRNLAMEPSQSEFVKEIREKMETELVSQGDPRMVGDGAVFDRYRATNGSGFYDKYLRGEKPKANWILETDIELEPLHP